MHIDFCQNGDFYEKINQLRRRNTFGIGKWRWSDLFWTKPITPLSTSYFLQPTQCDALASRYYFCWLVQEFYYANLRFQRNSKKAATSMKPFFKLFTNKAAMLGFYTFNTTPSYSLRPILANSKILVFQPLFAKLTPHSQKCEGVFWGEYQTLSWGVSWGGPHRQSP